MGIPISDLWGVCHLPYGITVLLASRHRRTHPALTPTSEGWYSIYLPRRDGRLSWPTLARPCVDPSLKYEVPVPWTQFDIGGFRVLALNCMW